MSDGAGLSALNSFSDPSVDEWRAFAEKSLRGKPLEPMLTHSLGGVDVSAFASAAAAATDYKPAFSRSGDWRIGAIHQLVNKRVHEAVLDDLRGGVNALTIDCTGFDGDIAVALDAVLEGVFPEMISLSFSGLQQHHLASVQAVLSQKASFLALHLGFDPIGDAVVSETEGALTASFSAVPHHANGTAITVSGRNLHNAGASVATELAGVLAIGLASLRELEGEAGDIAGAAANLRLSLAADTDYFATIAKFRAAHRLWQGILHDCGAGDVAFGIEAIQSSRSLTAHEPATNAIRQSVAGMAGGLGGADTVTLLGFKGKTPESYRLQRNAQLMMLEESRLGMVNDPAAGSYALERWTTEVMMVAWSKLQGYEEAAQDGTSALVLAIKADIALDKAALLADVENLKKGVIGVTRFPDLSGTAEQMEPNPHSLTAEIEACLGLSDAFAAKEGRRAILSLDEADDKAIAKLKLLGIAIEGDGETADGTLTPGLSGLGFADINACLSRLMENDA